MTVKNVAYTLVAFLLPIGLAMLGGVAFYSLWNTTSASSSPLERRLPGQDGTPDDIGKADWGEISGQLITSDGVPADWPGSWPRFRGEAFDNICADSVPLADEWPAEGPKVLWTQHVGAGFAGASIWSGRVYVMDHDEEKRADAIRCLSLEDGREIWRYTYPMKIKGDHSITRTIPTVTESYVVGIGPKCQVTCLNSVTGEFCWMIDLVRDYGTTIPRWYTAQCPVIEDGKVILAPGGPSCLRMAVDCKTGEVVWQTPNPDGWGMTHSSIIPMGFKGRHTYVYCGGNHENGGVIGVSAEDGTVVWRTTEWKVGTNVPVPIVVGEDRLFVSAGYAEHRIRGKGCAMLRLLETDRGIEIETEFFHHPNVYGTMQQTPILYKDHLYGIDMKKELVCLDLTGEVIWKSTSVNKFGFGPFLIADDRLYVLDDDGVLSMVDPSPEGFKSLARATMFEEAHDTWGPMAIAAGRLIMRDLHRMICVDVRK